MITRLAPLRDGRKTAAAVQGESPRTARVRVWAPGWAPGEQSLARAKGLKRGASHGETRSCG